MKSLTNSKMVILMHLNAFKSQAKLFESLPWDQLA